MMSIKPVLKPFLSASDKTLKIVPAITLISFAMGLSACQKSDEPNVDTETDYPKVERTTDDKIDIDLQEVEAESKTINQDQALENSTKDEASLEVDNNSDDNSDDKNTLKGTGSKNDLELDSLDNANIETKGTNKKPSLSDKQVTDVEYRNASGQVIYVTFQTSAVDALEADLKLPSGKRVVLVAPSGQGNNPTYRSKDGSIELVTHGGGGSIDLIYDGKRSKYDAVSAEAEVVSPA